MKRGFTLIEMMVGLSVGLIVAAAALTFMVQEMRLIARTKEMLEIEQHARSATLVLTNDIRKAGTEIGYKYTNGTDGNRFFSGILSYNGNLTVEYAELLPSTVILARDVHPHYLIYTCGTPVQNYETQGEAILLSRDASESIHGVLQPVFLFEDEGPQCPCSDTACRSDLLTEATPFSGENAPYTNFAGGSITPGYKRYHWEIDDEYNLRRNGARVALNIELVNLRVWAHEDTGWRLLPAATTSNVLPRTVDGMQVNTASVYESDEKLRVDIEIVARSSKILLGPKGKQVTPMTSGFGMGPGGCSIGTPGCYEPEDGYYRDVVRTSVRVVNAGLL